MPNGRLSATPAHSSQRLSDVPPAPYPFGSNQDPAVADQSGAGLPVNGENTGIAVKRHDQDPILSRWGRDPFRRMSQTPQPTKIRRDFFSITRAPPGAEHGSGMRWRRVCIRVSG
jgi:hypothetical protein